MFRQYLYVGIYEGYEHKLTLVEVRSASDVPAQLPHPPLWQSLEEPVLLVPKAAETGLSSRHTASLRTLGFVLSAVQPVSQRHLSREDFQDSEGPGRGLHRMASRFVDNAGNGVLPPKDRRSQGQPLWPMAQGVAARQPISRQNTVALFDFEQLKWLRTACDREREPVVSGTVGRSVDCHKLRADRLPSRPSSSFESAPHIQSVLEVGWKGNMGEKTAGMTASEHWVGTGRM
ncbi:hypothetical protein QBC35DRAFT_129414 [Podospora australis]|uniref:Uncharacterized protein n=1 Tax=Podospora australis TaxID=1536484 RepID=A0AAN6X1F9_9PEZI|nr:hypothetical protein QBC35DRAFT_129414 [Podospora australis]